MTDAVIEQHLLGKETIGVYPLLPDETCWFLAADFDKKTWEYDALAFLETCTELNVPAYGEIRAMMQLEGTLDVVRACELGAV